MCGQGLVVVSLQITLIFNKDILNVLLSEIIRR